MAECDLSGCSGMARPVVCEGHTSKARAIVTELPTLYLRLRGALVPSKGQGEHVSGSRDPQAGMSMSVWSLMEDMVDHAWRWGSLAREHRTGDKIVRSRRPGPTLVNGVNALRRHDAKLLELSIAAEYVWTFTRIKRRADTLLRQDQLVHRLDPPCPACDMRTLCRYDGDEYVICVSCGARWDELSYRRLVKVLVWQAQNLRKEHA